MLHSCHTSCLASAEIHLRLFAICNSSSAYLYLFLFFCIIIITQLFYYIILYIINKCNITQHIVRMCINISRHFSSEQQFFEYQTIFSWESLILSTVLLADDKECSLTNNVDIQYQLINIKLLNLYWQFNVDQCKSLSQLS